MNQQQEICLLLRRAVSQPEKVSLLNTYSALSISYSAQEIHIQDNNTVLVKVDQMQILCMSREKSTYLRSEFLPGLAQAQVAEVDFTSNRALLTNFTYDRQDLSRRQQIRVEPRQTIIGLFYMDDENKNIVCQIADISLDGIGIYVTEDDIFPGKLTIGMNITLHFRLPIERDDELNTTYKSIPYSPPLEKDYRLFRRLYVPEPLMKYPSIWGKIGISREIKSVGCVVKGVVMNYSSEPELQRRRFGIRFTPIYDDLALRTSRANISKFIIQRQTEIIQEIREKYDLVSWLVMNEKPLTNLS